MNTPDVPSPRLPPTPLLPLPPLPPAPGTPPMIVVVVVVVVVVVASPLLLVLLPTAATAMDGPLQNGSKSGTSNDISSEADDSGPARSLVIENDVSGKALAKEASKASRLLSRPNDDDDVDELLEDVEDDFLAIPDPPLAPAPPALVPTPKDDVVGSVDNMTSPGMRSSVVAVLFALRT
jgi:hypothetical protein